ncbi:hypothetical protein [Demequina litorisediminis]|uniref:Uncharacterized protein n=1 Tax=Demequina litorisediminis TaxID=1849022 RepID=A0ABQ6IDD4_9MICO|nr:hypothetical protein [Demequina litorisediminis]GMA35266.1 hypothetical protein GCM10025876_14700 [Demequina litorisediminis]
MWRRWRRRGPSAEGQAAPVANDPARALADAVAMLDAGLPPERAWAMAGVEVDADGAPAASAFREDPGLGDAVAAAVRLAGEGECRSRVCCAVSWWWCTPGGRRPMRVRRPSRDRA